MTETNRMLSIHLIKDLGYGAKEILYICLSIYCLQFLW